MRDGRVLLFDLGGVLVDFAGFTELRTHCALDDEEIRTRWLASPAVRSFERGQRSPAQFGREFVAEWSLALAPDEFVAAFTAWHRGLYPGAEPLLRELRTRHRLACLSNSNEAHWDARPELWALFDQVFPSHQLGVVKPDRGIFERVVERLAVAPSRILFFDDSPTNVAAAREVGLSAYRTDGFDELVATLTALGLTTRSTASRQPIASRSSTGS